MDTIYKTLNGVRPAIADTTYRYPGVGRWARHLDPDKLELCRYGYHYVEGSQVLDWLADTIYEAEPCPDHEPLSGGGKLVSCRLRLVRRFDGWTPRSAVLFAVDCAEHVLPLFEVVFPDDSRPREMIVAVRRFVDGEIGAADLATARYAVWAAWVANVDSGYAASAAAKAARVATWYARAAVWTTWAVDIDAGRAARAAAWAAQAARDSVTWADRAAEKEWQYQRLTEYLERTATATTDRGGQ